MPYLRLNDVTTHSVTEARTSPVRLGRDPDSTIVVRGDAANFVSARHAEIRFEGGAWLLTDLGSRNGTYLNGRRVSAAPPPPTPTALKPGDVIRLGESGPQYHVAAVTEPLATTLAEQPGVQVSPADKPAEVRAYGVTLLASATGRRYEARGTRIRLGRGRECEVQPVERSDTIVSRVHAELTVGPSGGLVVRDADSKNGTFLNGERITKPTPVRLGDKIMLGTGGPVLFVEGMGTAPQKVVRRRPPGTGAGAGLGHETVIGLIGQALAKAKEERKKGGRGSTAFMKAVAEGRTFRRLALLVLVVLLLGAGVYGVYWLLSRHHTS